MSSKHFQLIMLWRLGSKTFLCTILFCWKYSGLSCWWQVVTSCYNVVTSVKIISHECTDHWSLCWSETDTGDQWVRCVMRLVLMIRGCWSHDCVLSADHDTVNTDLTPLTHIIINDLTWFCYSRLPIWERFSCPEYSQFCILDYTPTSWPVLEWHQTQTINNRSPSSTLLHQLLHQLISEVNISYWQRL